MMLEFPYHIPTNDKKLLRPNPYLPPSPQLDLQPHTDNITHQTVHILDTIIRIFPYLPHIK